jgi:hypothetical protein
MEDLQWRYKDQAFRVTENDWVLHSRNMPCTTQSITFVNKEFVKRAIVEGQDAFNNDGDHDHDGAADRGNKYQSTVEPKHVQQLRMISEIFGLSRMFVETPGRDFTGKELREVLPKLTTVLSGSDDSDIIEDQEPEDTVLVTGMIGGELAADGADDGNIAENIVGLDSNDVPAAAAGLDVDELHPDDVLGEIIRKYRSETRRKNSIT